MSLRGFYEKQAELAKRGHVVKYRDDGSAGTASKNWDTVHLIQQIRSAVEAQLDRVESKIKNKGVSNGAKTMVFKEFAVLIRETVNLDPLIRQAIKDECASVLEDAQNAKNRALFAEQEYMRFLNELKQERAADPEMRRLREFVEVLNEAIPLQDESKWDRGKSAQVQALRSRGLAFAAFNGMKMVGGSSKYEESEVKTNDVINDTTHR